MVGDYNTVLNTITDRKGNHSTNYHPHEFKEISNIMDTMDLVDIWRLKNLNRTRYTWRRQNQASRIDYFLISFSMVPKVGKVLIEDKLRSDHQLIALHLVLTEFPRGRGYWKFNHNPLKDNIFITKTKEFITDFFSHNIGSADPLIVWDTFKCAFRGHSIQYSSLKQKQFISKEKKLTKEIEVLTLRVDGSDNTSIDVLDKLDGKQKELEELIQERSSKIYYRNKANWMEKGEKCNTFF